MRGTERRSLASSPSTSYSSSVTKFPAWMLFSSPMSYKVKGLFRLAWSHAVCITKWQTYMTRLISICRKQSLANTSVFVLQVSCHLYQILIQKQESFFSTSFNDKLTYGGNNVRHILRKWINNLSLQALDYPFELLLLKPGVSPLQTFFWSFISRTYR